MEFEELMKKTKKELIEEIQQWEERLEQLKKEIEINKSGKSFYTPSDLLPLFNSMSAIETAVYVADMQTYELLAVNEYIERVWGKGILGKKCYETLQVGQTTPCSFCTNDRLLNEKGEPNPPYVWVFQNTRTGSFFQCVDFAIPWENGKMVRLEVALNIDQFVKLQRERDTQTEILMTVIKNIPQAVFWKDKNGVFLGCNQQFALDANCDSPSDVIGKTDYDLPWTKEESESFRRMDKEIIETGVPSLLFEESQTRANGMIRYLLVSKAPLKDSEGNIIGVLGTYSDITELKKAHEILQKNEQLLNSLMQTAPFGVICVKNRIIEWCNERMEQIFGYSRDELIGKSTREYYESEEEYLRVGDIIYNNLVGNEMVWTETRWKTKDGSYIDVRINVALKDSEKPDEGVVCGILDITEQKKREEQEKQMLERMYHIQRIQSLEVLSGGVAHDFNNILMAIIGSAELAMHEIPEISPAQHYLQEIVNASKKGAELATQMLSYAGKRKLVARKININNLVNEMTQILKATISRKAILKLDLAEEIPMIEGDATQISQIIMNLVVNASEAMGNKSGVIVLRTGARICEQQYLDTLFLPNELKEGLYVVLEVVDTGCGMDEEAKIHLFEPFYTTKFTGRGLGMATVLGIVRNHKGGIKVYSEEGKGTTIKIFLPAIEWEAERQTVFTTDSKEWRGSGKVLLAEDDETICALTQRMLQYLGFEVFVAVDGREAVQIFEQNRDSISAVILDMTMPHMDGIEACLAIRKISESVPIILTSGHPQDELNKKINQSCISGYLQKPYRFEELKTVLMNIHHVE
ncbi:MAG TPA: PAS domain S-box protein [Candidatus Hydrogenedens sp.]|nr:PAS domain S-box protein [Candidatus Hydrogenedens sp.]HOL20665.1 PAS domain S-box protein [Candidatus Hydrogenedens sp.]HPP58707.1 PAS domain S-box protein [Candidatus Hydrogenedens sp.]